MLVKDIESRKQLHNLDPNSFYIPEEDYLILKEKATLKLIVDAPCLAACNYLYDLNIRVVSSSCNKTDIDHAYITIDFGTLSTENVEVYESLVSMGMIEKGFLEEQEQYIGFNITVPLSNLSTVEDVSKRFCLIAKMFKPQDVLYGSIPKKVAQKMILPYLKKNKLFGDIFDYIVNSAEKESSDIETDIIDKIIGTDIIDTILKSFAYWKNYYYEDEKEVYWLSQDLYEKHKNYQNNLKKAKDKKISL